MWKTKFLTDLNKTSQAVNVIWVLLVDLFIHLVGLLEEVHSTVARCNHKLPLHFLWLDLVCPLEVSDGLLEAILLGMMHTECGDHIDFRWVVPEGLLVEVDSLELILLLLVQESHLCEDLRVALDVLSDQHVVPLESLSAHADILIHVSNLEENLITIWDNRVKFLESLQRFIVVSELLVNKSKVVNSLDTISFDTNSLQEELLCSIILVSHEESISFVDKSLGVVPVMLDGKICEVLGLLEVILQEVKE